MSPAQTVSQTIILVAKREFRARVASKAFLIGNAVVLVLILAGTIGAAVVDGRSDDRTKIGLVGPAQSLAAPLEVASKQLNEKVAVESLDEKGARAKVADGDLDVAVLGAADGSYQAVVDERLPDDTRTLLESTAQQQAVNAALEEQEVDPSSLAAAASAATLSIDATDPPDPDASERTGLAYIALVLMFFQIFLFGLYVAMGVVEEKSSRVVEVLLATIKPLHLLWGKVIGIGTVGLAQLLAYGVVGLGAGIATGLVTLPGTAVAVFVSVLGWFVLGYTFFAVLYAAAGSLVSRQEDVNSVTMPITALIMAMYVLAQVTVQDPGSTLASVMSWIPPFSAMLMPLRIAAGETGLLQIVGTVILMVVSTSVLALVAAKIYERSVLGSGQRMSWREALGRSG